MLYLNVNIFIFLMIFFENINKKGRLGEAGEAG
jgi:hypothetical protein